MPAVRCGLLLATKLPLSSPVQVHKLDAEHEEAAGDQHTALSATQKLACGVEVTLGVIHLHAWNQKSDLGQQEGEFVRLLEVSPTPALAFMTYMCHQQAAKAACSHSRMLCLRVTHCSPEDDDAQHVHAHRQSVSLTHSSDTQI
jgi:hypothetical protein